MRIGGLGKGSGFQINGRTAQSSSATSFAIMAIMSDAARMLPAEKR
jgi:hypothetical protein